MSARPPPQNTGTSCVNITVVYPNILPGNYILHFSLKYSTLHEIPYQEVCRPHPTQGLPKNKKKGKKIIIYVSQVLFS